MSISATALLVVDVQESFRHRPYWRDSDVPSFVECLQSLIDGAQSRKISHPNFSRRGFRTILSGIGLCRAAAGFVFHA